MTTKIASIGLLVILVPPIAAEVVVEDSSNDHVIIADGVQPPEKWTTLDLLSLDIVERIDELEFVLAVQDVNPSLDEVPILDAVLYDVYAAFGDKVYLLTMLQGFTAGFPPVTGADLFVSTESGFHKIADPVVTVDYAANSYHAIVPRELLLNQDSAPLDIGSQLEDVWVMSRGVLQNQADVAATDRMPDTGSGAWTATLGLEQTGSARLLSTMPIRTSNGGAATYLFNVTARNVGDVADIYALRSVDVPETWDISYPVGEVRLEPGMERALPVVVTVPSRHVHGETEGFVLELASLTDSSTGRIQLGIHYPTIAQPAGHHPTLFFHSRSALPTDLFINTAEDDPADEGIDVEAHDEGVYRDRGPTVFWEVGLSPPLAMGLAFDVAMNGTIRIPMVSSVPHIGVRLHGEVFVQGDEHIVVADLASINAADLLPEQPVDLEATITMRPGVARLPPGSGNLGVLLAVSTWGSVFPSIDGPRILAGGVMELPLLEYQDPLAMRVVQNDGIGLRVVGDTHRPVNAGESVLFEVEVTSPVAERVGLALGGTNADWARIVSGDGVDLGAGERRSIYVEVAAPATAVAGSAAELVLIATAEGAADAAIQLVAQVTDVDVPDEGELAKQHEPSARDAAGAQVAWLFLVIVGAAWHTCRRQR